MIVASAGRDGASKLHFVDPCPFGLRSVRQLNGFRLPRASLRLPGPYREPEGKIASHACQAVAYDAPPQMRS